jgi:hypothetical protein
MHKGQLLASVPFDPFMMAPFLEKTLPAVGVEIVYKSWVVDAVKNGNTITHVVVAGKDGLKAIPAKAFIDATAGGLGQTGTGEACVVECADGSAYLNSRNESLTATHHSRDFVIPTTREKCSSAIRP